MADPSTLPPRTSHYFTPALYERLRADSRHWSQSSPVADPGLRGEAEAFLFLEARLLDQGRFEAWLDLYDDECVYWVPSRPGGGDPEQEVALALDDRRRLEDRVVWLRSAYVWSQIPRSRTVRMITNVEAVRHEGDLVVRSNFVLHDARGARQATHFGWYLHRVATSADGWRIRAKHVYLAQSDQPHENTSIIF
jgi:3-phenylpropionate/cinnamic acid dioxygenase small subunit